MNRDRLKEILKEEITNYLNETVDVTPGAWDNKPSTLAGGHVEGGLEQAVARVPLLLKGIQGATSYRQLADAITEFLELVVDKQGVPLEKQVPLINTAMITSLRNIKKAAAAGEQGIEAKPAPRGAIPTGGEVAGGPPAAGTVKIGAPGGAAAARKQKRLRPQAARIRGLEEDRKQTSKKESKK